MIYILQIDTSGVAGSVSVSADGKLLAAVSNEQSRDHAARVHSMIDDTLTTAGLGLKDLHAIAVCGGPGSYTGLRIGLAVAKGLCYALDLPLILQNRLELICFASRELHGSAYAHYAALLLAREHEYFLAVYDNDMTEKIAPVHLRHDICEEIISKFADNLYLDTDINEIDKIFDTEKMHTHPLGKTDAGAMALHAFYAYRDNKISSLSAAEPYYLKEVFINK